MLYLNSRMSFLLPNTVFVCLVWDKRVIYPYPMFVISTILKSIIFFSSSVDENMYAYVFNYIGLLDLHSLKCINSSKHKLFYSQQSSFSINKSHFHKNSVQSGYNILKFHLHKLIFHLLSFLKGSLGLQFLLLMSFLSQMALFNLNVRGKD